MAQMENPRDEHRAIEHTRFDPHLDRCVFHVHSDGVWDCLIPAFGLSSSGHRSLDEAFEAAQASVPSIAWGREGFRLGDVPPANRAQFINEVSATTDTVFLAAVMQDIWYGSTLHTSMMQIAENTHETLHDRWQQLFFRSRCPVIAVSCFRAAVYRALPMLPPDTISVVEESLKQHIWTPAERLARRDTTPT
jgi:hypothetical protein